MLGLLGTKKIPLLGGSSISLLQQVIALGPTVLYDISDLSTLFSDRSATPSTPASVDGVVGTVLDLSGNGNHLVFPSDAARPILRQSDIYYYLELDGVDDWALPLNTQTAVPLTATWSHVGAYRHTGGIYERLFGTSTNFRNSVYLGAPVDTVVCYDKDATGQDDLASGTLTNDFVVSIVKSSDASMSGWLDGTSGATYDPYDDAGTAGLALFSDRNTFGVNLLEGRFYGGAWWAGTTLSDTDRQIAEQWAASLTEVSL